MTAQIEKTTSNGGPSSKIYIYIYIYIYARTTVLVSALARSVAVVWTRLRWASKAAQIWHRIGQRPIIKKKIMVTFIRNIVRDFRVHTQVAIWTILVIVSSAGVSLKSARVTSIGLLRSTWAFTLGPNRGTNFGRPQSGNGRAEPEALLIWNVLLNLHLWLIIPEPSRS
jgi:hypothetical protein